ncbi:OmpA family protein [Acetobacter oeni]|uniref:OmpA family protein n=1 Tax=Acetobacter oeni TaxID=304077 RepID=UPI001A7E31B6|nr:OmpA family protein [Acetobacter oeni]
MSAPSLQRAFSPRMRLVISLTGLATACVTPFSGPALAQVTTDTSALDSITPAKKPAPAANNTQKTSPHTRDRAKTPPRNSHETAKPAATTSPATAATAGTTGSRTATPAHPGKPPPSPTIPPAPPPLPVLTPPPIPVELHPFPMPPDPAPEKDAVGIASPITGGMRITFAPDSAKLNTETRAAILAVVQSLKERPETRVMVDATSSDATNDPSRPRRMSLSRGLVVRAVLMNAGIPSTRIYVRVIGSSSKTDLLNPADRVDIRRSDAVP